MTQKVLNTEKTIRRKNYGFDELFEVLDEIDNNCHKLNAYIPGLLI